MKTENKKPVRSQSGALIRRNGLKVILDFKNASIPVSIFLFLGCSASSQSKSKIEKATEKNIQPSIVVSNGDDSPKMMIWASRVKKQSDLAWKSIPRKKGQDSGNCEVTFRVNREGKIIKIEPSSCENGVKAIESIDSVPPLTESFSKDTMNVQVKFICP